MIDRRQLLAWVLALGCTTVASRSGWTNISKTDELNVPRLIGAYYLEMHPNEGKVVELIRFLRQSIPEFSWNRDDLKSTLSQDGIREACASDFQRDDVDSIGGWLLSRTELRLCALISIS